MRFFKLFKKPTTKPLPIYPPIKMSDIPPASSLLFYGGNKLTELAGNRLYDHPYKPPAFHAAFYIEDGLFLNVGKFKTVQNLKDEFRSTRRVDVIIYRGIKPEKRERLCRAAYLDADKPKIGLSLPTYAVTDYLRFGLRWFKPSKMDFCSENVVELFATEKVRVSEQEPYNTAPWDIEEYAEKFAQEQKIEIYSVWIGPDWVWS